jgi:hypothetical protein
MCPFSHRVFLVVCLALAVQGASGAGAPKVSRPGVYTGYSAQLYSDVSIHCERYIKPILFGSMSGLSLEE